MKLNAFTKATPNAWLLKRYLIMMDSGLPWISGSLKRQIAMTMKLTTLLLIVALMQVSAKGFSQRISLNATNVPLEKVLHNIESQSGYVFFFDTKLVKQNVTVKINDASITDALNACLKSSALTFQIADKTIFIRKKKEQVPAPNVAPVPVKVSGRVTDTLGKTLPGATVLNKNTRKAVLTNDNGEFTLDANAGDQIAVSFIGYNFYTFSVTEGIPFQNVILHEGVSKLNEVVVSNGYQSLPLEKATGSYEQVGKDLLNRSVGTNVLGRLEGVSSILFDKRIGHDGELAVRGRSTLFANAAPLIVLDNFPYYGDINNINPNDIESITILKDASASAIWGVRASNGVIIVTTKKGARNKPLTVNFNANVTMADKPDAFYPPRMSSADFVDLEKQLFAKGFYSDDENSFAHVALSPVVELLIAQRDGTISAAEADKQINALAGQDVRNDLQRYWYKHAVNQQYALSLSGGSDKTSYLFSAGYDHNLTTLDGTYQRLNLRSANSFRFTERLQLDVSAYITDSKTLAGRNDPSSLVSIDGKELYPYAQLADSKGNALPVALDYRSSFISSSEAQGFQNWDYYPLSDYKNVTNRNNQLDLLLNTALKYKVWKGMDAEVRYQLESAQTQGSWLYGSNSYYSRNLVNQYTQVNGDGSLTLPVPAGGVMDGSDSRLLSNNFRVQLNYNNNWDKHQLTALAGYEYRNDHTHDRNFRDYGYDEDIQQGSPVDYVTSYLLSNYSYFIDSPVPYVNSYSSADNYNLSYYANLAYAYANRYSISASGRKDESNLFGVNANQKGVPLYSVGAAWTASNEAFYKVAWLPYLKLRLSYGYSGNVDNTLAAQAAIRYVGQSPLGKQTYASINNPPNPNLGWEKTGILNADLDFALAGNVLSGSLEYYRKKSTDLIGFQPLDQTTGVINPATNLFQYKGNVAAMKGSGVEVNLHSNNLTGAFKWQTDLLFNYAANTVTKYYSYNDLGSNYVANGLSVSPLVGMPLYTILTYKWAGLDPQTGDPQGYVNGQISKDYQAIISGTKTADLQYSGPGVPPFFGNFRNTVSYWGVSLSANISYKLGYYFMRTGISYAALLSSRATESDDYARRWQKPGDEKRTNVPSFVYPADSQRDQFYNQSAVNVEKGDHIRLQDIRLSYDIKPSDLRFMALKHLQVYAYAANLGLIWKSTKTALYPDYPYSVKPPKTFALGINGSF